MSLLGICIIHTAHFALSPPSNLPDLFVMLFAIFSFLHFAAALVSLNIYLWALITFDSERYTLILKRGSHPQVRKSKLNKNKHCTQKLHLQFMPLKVHINTKPKQGGLLIDSGCIG